ncbi:MAG: response regulator transcription factor [Xanthomonadales bacterium]|nr:response regulator transcription factor [Xanthomonadales bacterium]
MNTPAKSPTLRVLLVEDSLALRQSLGALFESRGHQIDFAADGRSGLALALSEPPDVLVLDLGLPGMDGLRVCQALREQADRHIPILMLTARDQVEDKLAGFTAGADDYLVKPFAAEELMARCLALSQRHRVGNAYRLQIGSLCIDRRSGIASRAGQALDLQGIPLKILRMLAESWPRAVTRSELLRELWPDEVPASDPLRSHLYLLRQALDRPFEKPMLRTVHGIGFALDERA